MAAPLCVHCVFSVENVGMGWHRSPFEVLDLVLREPPSLAMITVPSNQVGA
jgi:hypothetical protein